MTKNPISFESIQKFYAENEKSLRDLGANVEYLMVHGRESLEVPIYVTKMRIKRPESVYLKNKRKAYKDLYGITDLVGLRALCLFEQDILPTFQYLTSLFMGFEKADDGPKLSFELKEIKFFNWSESAWRDTFGDCIKRSFAKNAVKNFKFEDIEVKQKQIHFTATDKPQHCKFDLVDRGSGYKSIHFVVKVGKISLEVQLRTLLQDVWGELEHSLSYKQGFVHPHITNNFQLFSRELQTKDELMSHLRDIRDKESSVDEYTASKAGPNSWLDFDSTLIADVFNSPDLKKKYAAYSRDCSAFKPRKLHRTELDKIKKDLEDIERALEDRRDEPCVLHWISMECAFLRFCEGEHDAALEIYEKEVGIEKFPYNRWAAYYRMGEILITRGQIEKALIQFDLCGQAISSGTGSRVEERELYLVNSKLAFVYWSLGPEYIDIAVEKINEAEAHIEAHVESLPKDGEEQRARISLSNNLCYYYMESWLEAIRSKANGVETFDKHTLATKRYQQLTNIVEQYPEYVSSNSYDTLSWFSYNAYLETSTDPDPEKRKEGLESLLTAKKYIDLAVGKENLGISQLTAANLQRRHMQEIMVKFERAVALGILRQ